MRSHTYDMAITNNAVHRPQRRVDVLHDVPWHISAPCCFQRPKSPSNPIRKYCLDLLSMVALCCSAMGGRYMLITKTLSRQASMWSMLSFAFLGMYQLHVAFRDQHHPARLQQSHQKPSDGLDLTCQHTTENSGMLLSEAQCTRVHLGVRPV